MRKILLGLLLCTIPFLTLIGSDGEITGLVIWAFGFFGIIGIILFIIGLLESLSEGKGNGKIGLFLFNIITLIGLSCIIYLLWNMNVNSSAPQMIYFALFFLIVNIGGWISLFKNKNSYGKITKSPLNSSRIGAKTGPLGITEYNLGDIFKTKK